MSEQEVTTPAKKNGAYVLVILLLLLGVGAMTFLWSSTKSKLADANRTNQEMQKSIEDMEAMLSEYTGEISNDLRKDLKNMLSTYDALMEKDKSQADSINVQKAKIEELLAQVERGKMTSYQLSKMKRENETLRNIMKGYVYQIDSLNTLNLKLTSDLDVTKTALNETSTERDNFKQQAETSQAKVKAGSKLQAYGFNSIALRSKLNDMTTETTKAKNTIQIKSSFTIGANPITESGRKTVYMQVIKPDGKTFQTKASNVVSTDAGSFAYSDKKEIDYNNEAVDMAIYYDLRGEEAPKGNYSVKIYCEGQLIGKDSFTLK